MTIEPKMKQLSAFLVAGTTVRTVNKDEERPESAKLPGLWSRFYAEALAAEVPHAIAESPIYGVYHDYEAD
ncbi:MAG: GyrI-like domain-containing protein, partial [Acidobacteriaceae bacterium]|nr:GyrI-like domain-containing protein [Acidobacteriaceae bacterium]